MGDGRWGMAMVACAAGIGRITTGFEFQGLYWVPVAPRGGGEGGEREEGRKWDAE
jgi:hypothetical protein